jgi:NADPH:quinone reductase-like Zn-dependent oxidoreductase
MQAINYTKYGPLNVLKLEEVRKPVPGNEEVLVRILASSVNFGNVALVKGEPFVSRFWSGLIKPKYTNPGSDISGVVEEVGKEVTRFKPGDEVIGDLVGCGLGAYAQYVACPESVLAMKPAGNIQPGQKVLIYGASGGNGTFAVQVAKAFGAEVTGVCSTKNMELVRSIGADHVIDYTREDLFSQGGGYDLILSTAGYQSIYDYKQALGPRGTYVSAGGAMKQVNQGMLLGPLLSSMGGKKLTFLYQRTSQEDLFTMKELIEAGKVMPVIDRIYPLEDTIYAMEYYSKGRSRGKVIITMQDGMAE